MNYGWDEIKIMLEKDSFDVYQPDATFAGGIRQVRRVMDAVREKGRDFTPHTWTNGIGFYINWNMVLADKDNHLPLEYPLRRAFMAARVQGGDHCTHHTDRGYASAVPKTGLDSKSTGGSSENTGSGFSGHPRGV